MGKGHQVVCQGVNEGHCDPNSRPGWMSLMRPGPALSLVVHLMPHPLSFIFLVPPQTGRGEVGL